MQFTTLQHAAVEDSPRSSYELDKLTFQTFVIDHLLGMHLFASLHFDIYFDIFVYISVFFI